MKTLFLSSVLVVSMLLTFSCTKEEEDPETPQKGITYPDSIYYGKSILNMADSVTVLSWKSYGFAANLEKDATLTIKLTDLSVPDTTGYHAKWYYSIAPIPVGWTAQIWNNGTQTFIATQTGKIDVMIKFNNESDTPSVCRLDFYENSTTVTKSKFLRISQ